MANALNLDLSTLVYTTDQTLNGILYFDGTKVVSNSQFTYNGDEQLYLMSFNNNPSILIDDQNPFLGSSASLTLSRYDDFGKASIFFSEDNLAVWEVTMDGNYGSSVDIVFRDTQNGVNRFMFGITGLLTIEALTASTLLGTSAGKVVTNVDLSGDVTTSGSFATTIANHAVTNAKLRQSPSLSLMGQPGATGDVQDIIANFDGNVMRRSGGTIGWGAINLASSNAVSGILLAANGGTSNGFTAFTGPTTSTKTFTLPNANATILTDNSVITPSQGGTGITSYSVGDIIYASATNVLSKLSDVMTGNALISGGVNTAPSWGKIGLTTHVTGVLPYANGGFNPANQTIGGIVYIDGAPDMLSNAGFTYNGAGAVVLTSGSTLGRFSVVNTLTGANNQAVIYITRADQANGQAQVRFATGATDLWYLGLRTGNNSIHFYDQQNSVDRFIFDQSGNLQITALTASLAVFTDSSKNLTSTGTVGQSQGGTNATSYGANQIIFQNSGNTAFTSSSAITAGTNQINVFATVAATTATIIADNTDNTDDTSRGVLRARTGGSSGGDPYTRYTVLSNTDWSSGIDNSDSDAYIIGNASTLGSTGNRLRIGTDAQVTLSNGSVTAPTPTTQLNINSATQASARIIMSGQEFYQASNTSAEGLAFLLGQNRTSKQLWLGDSSRLTQNTTNQTIRMIVSANGTPLRVDGISTDGSTNIDIEFGSTGAATKLQGNALTLTGGDVTASTGNLIINTVNKGLQIKGAAVSAGTANASFVTSVVLVGGTVTVNNSFVTTACSGTIAVATAGGTPGTGYRLNVGAGTFTVTSSSALDTSTLTVAFFKGI